MRARGRRPAQSLDAGSADADAPLPAALLEADNPAGPPELDDEQRDQVRSMIAQMPESQRMILVLGYYQKLPYAEIAGILDVPVGTVKSRLHAAVQHFARLWLARTKTSSPER